MYGSFKTPGSSSSTVKTFWLPAPRPPLVSAVITSCDSGRSPVRGVVSTNPAGVARQSPDNVPPAADRPSARQSTCRRLSDSDSDSVTASTMFPAVTDGYHDRWHSGHLVESHCSLIVWTTTRQRRDRHRVENQSQQPSGTRHPHTLPDLALPGAEDEAERRAVEEAPSVRPARGASWGAKPCESPAGRSARPHTCDPFRPAHSPSERTATDSPECFASRGSWVRVPSSPPRFPWSRACAGGGEVGRAARTPRRLRETDWYGTTR